jgi:hypothetical protein
MTEHYVGTKIIMAWSQAHADGREGYTVKYEDGYTSWSPKDVFEAAYLPIGHVGHLASHIQRVVGEKAQNDDRALKLDAFLSSEKAVNLPADAVGLMEDQLRLMRELSVVLGDRLALMGSD